MHFGFSYTGLIFLAMLFIPNLIWTRYKPEGYEAYAAKENKALGILEKAGQALVCGLVLIFSDFNPQGWSHWLGWLLGALALMLLYEGWWVSYFRSSRKMADFYRGFLGIPLAGAVLPVGAFLLLSVYGKNPFLFLAAVILGIGHIGIHAGHAKEIREEL